MEVSRLSQSLSAVISWDDVLFNLFEFLKATLQPRKIIVLWHDQEQKQFRPIAARGAKNFQATVPDTHVLARFLAHAKQPLMQRHIDKLVQATGHKHEEATQIKKIRAAMSWLDSAIAIPLLVGRETKSIILLGQKKGGRLYTRGDMKIIRMMQPIIAIALHNAYLHQEAVAVGEKMRAEIDRTLAELRHANTQLKELDSAKSEFLAIASHQLYTPLTAMRGYVSMLNEGDFGELTGKQRRVLEMVEKSAERLLQFTNSLLDISRIESGRIQLNLESVDLNKVAADLVEQLRPNANKKNLHLEFHPGPGDMPQAVVDEQRISHVMLNLIDNAIKYTQAGRVDVTVYPKDTNVVFAVADTGKGMTAEQIKKLFTKFTRVGAAARVHTEGTGLGLYVARQIVKEHHGDVLAESSGEGKGSTFSMTLPAEGTPKSLKVGEKVSVEIKAAEATGLRQKARA